MTQDFENGKENGYVSIFRNLKDESFYTNSKYVHLWVHLLLSANYQPKKILWNGGEIEIGVGQFLTGRKKLAKLTGISETTVERILEFLESGHHIGQQKTNKYRLITILKWDKYQLTDTKTDIKRTTNGQQTDTNNNNNKENKENKERGHPSPIFKKPTIDEVRNYLTEKGREDLVDNLYNYYESNGWKVGRNKMKDWKATCRGWIARDKKPQGVKVLTFKTK